MKSVNLTNKLSLSNERPRIYVGDVFVEVNNDAASILSLAETMGNRSNFSLADIVKMVNTLFDGENQEKINAMKLNFADYKTLLMAAVKLASDMGEGNAKN